MDEVRIRERKVVKKVELGEEWRGRRGSILTLKGTVNRICNLLKFYWLIQADF